MVVCTFGVAIRERDCRVGLTVAEMGVEDKPGTNRHK